MCTNKCKDYSHLDSFGLCVQARSVKAVCVDSWCVCRVWTGCRGGQNMCVSRALQAAWWSCTAEAAHTATALATSTHKHTHTRGVLYRGQVVSRCYLQTHKWVYLPEVCAAPRYPHWCCSAVLELESLEDSAQQSSNLRCTHTHTHTQTHTHTHTHTQTHTCYH